MSVDVVDKIKEDDEGFMSIDESNLTPQNVPLLLLEIPILHSKYLKGYSKNRRVAEELKQSIKEYYAKYYYAKITSKIRKFTKHDIETMVEGETEYIEMVNKHIIFKNRQDYYELKLKSLKDVSFALKSYIEWEKFLAGA